MSRLIIVEGNSSDKDNVRAIMVKGEKGEKGDNGEITYSDVVDNLTSTETQKPLSANQGKQLKDLIDANESVTDESISDLNSSINTINDTLLTKADNASVQNNYAKKTELNDATNNLSSQISSLASGSPLVASSVSGMTDTTKIYVNTSDGKWYYYNGSSWVAGGTYQSTGTADESIGIRYLQSELKNHYLFETNWLKGSANISQGMYEPSTNRIRTKRMIFLEKGTVINFTQDGDTPLRWSYQTFASTDNSSGVFNSGWKTDSVFVVEEDYYYCFMMSYNDNAPIDDDDIDTIASHLKIFRTLLNSANKMLNWYSGTFPFDIEELYDNDKVKFKTHSSYWIVFENLVEYYNRTSWGTTRKLTSKYITYDLGNYGTVTTTTSGGSTTDNIEVTLPNNYCLVLDVVTGVMSVKFVGDVDVNDALLLRNCLGYAVHGAFREIYDFWDNIKNINRINVLEATINNLEINNSINYDVNIKGIAHRGYSNVAPENTLPAYKLARKNGFKYVECDVSFTSDGVPVLLHDNTIDRTSNGTGNINNLTFEQVRQYDFGSWKSSTYAGTQIPSFEEFIVLCKNIGLSPYIELKNNATYTSTQIQSLVDTVNKYGMSGKVTWISFSLTYLSYVKNYDSKARLGYVVSTISSNTIVDINSLITNDNEVFINANYTNLTNETINLCIDNGIALEVWTVNNEEDILLLDTYITGVTSNYLIAGKVLYDSNIV